MKNIQPTAYLMFKNGSHSPKRKSKTRMSIFTTSTQHYTEGSNQMIRQGK